MKLRKNQAGTLAYSFVWSKKMNMISTGAFLNEIDAFDKRDTLVSKLVSAWEKKNSKAARAGGVSLMALSLAACGSSDNGEVTYTKAELDAAKLKAKTDAETKATNDAASLKVTTDAAAASLKVTTDAAAVKAAQDAAIAQAAAVSAVDKTTDNAAAIDTAVANLGHAGISNLAALNTAFTATLAAGGGTLTTAATDSPGMTSNNDIVSGTVRNSLQTGDVIADSSSTDADVINANVTVSNAAPTIRNVETINVVGDFLTVGLSLTNVTGSDNLNLSATLSGATATVIDAAATTAATITSGANIGTISVTALAAGTGAAGVTVDAGAATTVTIVGGAGVDVYNVSVPATAALALNTFTAADTTNVTLAGNSTVTSGAAMGTMNVTAADGAIMTAATAIGTATNFLGAGNVTLTTTGAIVDTATSVTSTGSGTLALNLTTVANDNVSNAAADVVNHNHATGTGLTVAATSVLNLDAAAGASTMNLSAAGTLEMTVSQTQTAAITTGANVTTLSLSATPDQAADTANGAVITMADLATNAATTTMAISGAAALTLTDLSAGAAMTINATNHSGAFVLSDSASALTIFTGTGTNSITANNNTSAFTITGNSNVDTITLTGAAASSVNGAGGNDVIVGSANADTLLAGGDGNDTISGAAGADTITGGAGNDTILAGAGVDTISVGTGSDSVSTVNGQDGDTVSDFVVGTDTLIVTGTAGAAFSAASQTVTAGAYNLTGGGNHDITLTGATATDLTGTLVLGSQSTAAVAGGVARGVTTYSSLTTAGVTTAGSGDDVIIVGGAAHTVTSGAGSDTILNPVTQAASISDFTMGTDTLILTGASTNTVDLTAIVPATGVYAVNGVNITLTGNTTSDLSGSVVLGHSGAVYTANGAVSTTFGNGDDYVAGVAATAQVFIIEDNGGVDTITVFTSASDTLNFDGMTGISAAGVALAANAAKVADAVDGEVYLFASNANTTTGETVDFNGAAGTAGLGSTEVMTDAAAFLEAGITESNGENYIAIMNIDGTAGGVHAIYEINADADGIQVDDMIFMGSVATAGANNLVIADIA
jgi:hypothetical protein